MALMQSQLQTSTVMSKLGANWGLQETQEATTESQVVGQIENPEIQNVSSLSVHYMEPEEEFLSFIDDFVGELEIPEESESTTGARLSTFGDRRP